MNKTSATLDQEPYVASEHKHLLCWKASVSGLAVSLFVFILMSSLGAGLAGFTAEGLISKEEGGFALATGSGLWLGLSAVIALFVGSYYAVRVSRYVTNKVGAAHGLLIASLFFILMVVGIGNILGGVAQGFGKLTVAAGESTSDLSQSPAIQDIVNRSLGGANLKSAPAEVTKGLAARLLSGNVDSAKNYYAYQTGQSSAEVDQKITQLKADFDATAKVAGEKTAHAIGDVGILLFAVLLVGLSAALIGGIVGAHTNSAQPFAVINLSPNFPAMASQRGSMVPYLLGWMMGVPISILLLIAMLRTVF